MIQAENLVRNYGSFTAVNSVSFTVAEGEIVGFLGPNGAGKSTTLKMLAGYLAPTSGKVRIGGQDMETEPRLCKTLTGYLPENNPLYEDMETADYLLWCGKMRGLEGAPLENAVAAAVADCGLQSAIGKSIGQLSKGYRQRTGIAAAMLHNPKILLLDEPTSGLDPNQAAEVRRLILSLRGKKTILFSTHLLNEANAVADRLLIISKGVIAANATAAALIAEEDGLARLTLSLEKGPKAEEAKTLFSAIEGVSECIVHDGAELHVTLRHDAARDIRKDVFSAAVKSGWTVLELSRETPSLEEVFRRLTA